MRSNRERIAYGYRKDASGEDAIRGQR